MEQVFASLSKRQTMLLLTALAMGGSEAVEAFAHLAPEEEELLKFRAQTLLQIPRDKRVPLLIQEMKRLLMQRKRQLAGADAKQLAALLKGERTAMLEVVLKAVPVDLASALREAMGTRPTVKIVREVKPEILSIIRWKLEDGLRQRTPAAGLFRFPDIGLLQQRELLAICERMGARVLSSAIAGLSEADREAFYGKLPPDQRQLAARAAEAARERRLNEDDSKTVLSIHGALEDPSAGIRSAGVQRVVRAALAQSPEFAQRMGDRQPGDFGKLYNRWLKDEKSRPVKGDGGRADIVEQMERLAQRGIIDRPMRLSPPSKAPPTPVRMPPRASSRAQVPAAVAPQGSTTEPVPRRDMMAQRAAERAGVVQRVPERRVANPNRAPDRVLRNGRPINRPDGATPRRAVASPAIQGVPKRKK